MNIIEFILYYQRTDQLGKFKFTYPLKKLRIHNFLEVEVDPLCKHFNTASLQRLALDCGNYLDYFSSGKLNEQFPKLIDLTLDDHSKYHDLNLAATQEPSEVATPHYCR